MNKGQFIHGAGRVLQVTFSAARNILWATSKLRDGVNNGVVTPLTGAKYYSITPHLEKKKSK